MSSTSPQVPAAVQEKKQERMQQVEIQGNLGYDPRRDDTAAKSVISQSELLKYGDTNVYEVLKRVPGITVVGKSIRMRGLGNEYTQILVNGQRPAPGFSLDLVVPDQIERIEVMRTASAEFSVQAIAGTINVVLKKASSKRQRDIRMNLGQSTETKSAMVLGTFSDRTDRLSYSVSGTVARNYNEGNGRTSQQSLAPNGSLVRYRDGIGTGGRDSTAATLQPRLNWKLSDDDQLLWNASLQTSRNDGHYASEYDCVIGSFGLPDYRSILTDNVSSALDFSTDLNWITKLGGGKLDFKVSLWESKVDSDVHLLSSTVDRLTRSNRDANSTSHFHTLGTSGKYARTIVDGHSLKLGWEASFQRSEELRLRVEGLVGEAPIRRADDFRPRVERLAWFVQDEWNISKQWSMYQGIRYETIRTENEGSDLPNTSSRSHFLGPVAQTLYKFPDGSGRQLRLSLTRTYKAPSVSQLTARRIESEVNTRFSPDSSGNPNLRPEMASGLDLTYEHFWAPGAMFSIGASARHITSYIRNVLAQSVDGRWVIAPINDGDASLHTLDAELKLPLKTVWKVMQGLEARAGINRNWSKVDRVPGPNNRLEQQTPFTATLGVDYKADIFNTGFNLARRSGGVIRSSEHQLTRTQTREELDAYLLYRLQAGVQLRAAVNNLLGRENRESYWYVDSSGIDQTWMVRPNSRRFQLSLELKL